MTTHTLGLEGATPTVTTKSKPVDGIMFPRWLRFWHWSNAIEFFALIVTGANLHFANIGTGSIAFRKSVVLHNVFGIALIALYLFYLGAQIVTGHWRQFIPRGGFRAILRHVRYFIWGIFRGEHHPFESTFVSRFNPIQRLAYVFAVYILFPAQGITGVALLFPDYAPKQVMGMAGIWPMAVGHSVLAYAFTSFLCIHMYLALTISEERTGLMPMIRGDKFRPTPSNPPPPLSSRAEHSSD